MKSLVTSLGVAAALLSGLPQALAEPKAAAQSVFVVLDDSSSTSMLRTDELFRRIGSQIVEDLRRSGRNATLVEDIAALPDPANVQRSTRAEALQRALAACTAGPAESCSDPVVMVRADKSVSVTGFGSRVSMRLTGDVIDPVTSATQSMVSPPATTIPVMQSCTSAACMKEAMGDKAAVMTAGFVSELGPLLPAVVAIDASATPEIVFDGGAQSRS